MTTSPFTLLALPDPCLLAVLQCVAAEDQYSLCSAARSHSRLHQAAVAALQRITVRVTQQQQMDGVLLYLDRHGQHVNSIHLTGVEEGALELRQLPSNLQLNSLHLEHLYLQLQPGNGSHGVLGAAVVAALKQLCLSDCKLLDGKEQLAAALWQLPDGLEHLSISGLIAEGLWVQVPPGVLQRLQQLTYLELTRCRLKSPVEGEPALQPLQALTRLQDLRLATVDKVPADDDRLDASMLAGAHHLTRLDVSGCWHEDGASFVQPGVLAGKTQLQHLQLAACSIAGVPIRTGGAQLLSYLRELQQLTFLGLSCSHSSELGDIPAAAFSALTASSKLQHLDISDLQLPAGAWQHVFPAGKQRPHLRSLNLAQITHPLTQGLFPASAPEGSRLVSCCPGLQSLDMQGLRYTAHLLPALQGLSGLHTLSLGASHAAEPLDGVCQLTGLRELSVYPRDGAKGLLLQLTQLKQLTALAYFGACGASNQTILACEVSCTPISCLACLSAVVHCFAEAVL
jgi:hypothetical protein